MDDDALIRRKLVETAEKKTTISYSELGALIGLDMGRIGERDRLSKILGRISAAEHAEGRPMLSAVAVLKDEMLPGKGFFQLARRLDLYGGRDRIAFFVAELGRVHDCWTK